MGWLDYHSSAWYSHHPGVNVGRGKGMTLSLHLAMALLVQEGAKHVVNVVAAEA